MDPQQEAIGKEFDKYSENYSAAVNAAIGVPGLTVDFFTQVKGQHLVRVLERAFERTESLDILDLGCGVGNYHRLVQPHVGTLSGADVSADCIATARRLNPQVRYEAYDGQRLPYPDNSFDGAFTICVMHHVPPAGWPGFVREMFRVLRPGGIAAVYEHNPLNPLTRLVVNRCAFDRDAVLLWPSQVRALLGDAGFKDIDGRSILTVPPKTKLLAGIDDAFGRLPFGAQYFVTGRKAAA